MSGPRRSLSGLAALAFLGGLGAIAWLVQQQAIPVDRDLLRTPATAIGLELAEPEEALALPWQDRLDLDAFGLALWEGADRSREGRLVQELEDGHRILTTLDPGLQDAALTIFRNREVPYAAAIVMDLSDNSILAFAGHSSADPQVDPLEILATPWAPAASVFKLVTAAALLETGAVGPETKACWHGGVHGLTDDLLADNPALDTRCDSLAAAIAHSHNVVIAKLALAHLSEDQLTRTASSLLWGAKIPFEFPIEPSPMHIPGDPKERAKVAAGFWHVDLSPIHAAVLVSVFARNGIYQPPHLVDQVLAPDGAELAIARPAPKRVLAEDVAERVALTMRATTTEGTAKKSFRDDSGVDFIPGVKVAGKTGSLTGKRAPAYNYNWFVGFAPADEPQIAFAVVLANDAQWRIKAHYAARRLVQIWLERKDHIHRARQARLTRTGLTVPHRDGATTRIVEAAPAVPPVADLAAPAPASEAEPAALPPPPTPLPLPGP